MLPAASLRSVGAIITAWGSRFSSERCDFSGGSWQTRWLCRLASSSTSPGNSTSRIDRGRMSTPSACQLNTSMRRRSRGVGYPEFGEIALELRDFPAARGCHRSTRALEDCKRLYLATNNADPKPFVWIKTADDILASIARFALRTSETGHWSRPPSG